MTDADAMPGKNMRVQYIGQAYHWTALGQGGQTPPAGPPEPTISPLLAEMADDNDFNMKITVIWEGRLLAKSMLDLELGQWLGPWPGPAVAPGSAY
eukprot:jgi/Tetstr1/433888/TSEL_023068.t1